MSKSTFQVAKKGWLPFSREATDHDSDWFDHFLVIKVRAQTAILEEGVMPTYTDASVQLTSQHSI